LVAFLEKHFEFTTSLSMVECAARLKAKSKRGTGFFASRRDILVSISDKVDGKAFTLDRDWGRNLYAKVHGQLRKNQNNTVTVSGFGRIRLSIFLFTLLYSFGSFYIGINISDETVGVSLIFFGMGIFAWALLLITFKNRDSLIKLVKQMLEANE